MKRIAALALSCLMLFTGCRMNEPPAAEQESSIAVVEMTNAVTTTAETEQTETETQESTTVTTELTLQIPEYPTVTELSDPDFLQYMNDSVYSEMEYLLESDDYIIEDISSIYISKEYLEELEYNSKENVFFGYTLSELDAQFAGTRYVFTLGESGETSVIPLEDREENVYVQMLKDVAIGTGVILLCVTISTVTAGSGLPTAVSMIFAASAKGAVNLAFSGAVIGGASAGIIKGIQTQSLEEAVKAAAVEGGKGFKYGAIIGAITSGAGEALNLHDSATTIPTPKESEKMVLERLGKGEAQVAFFNGKKTEKFINGCTIPDVILTNPDGTIEAIEVKNYNLTSNASLNELLNVLKKQITARIAHLPKGSTQRVVLDVRGRGYTKEYINQVINQIKMFVSDIYPNLPVEALAY